MTGRAQWKDEPLGEIAPTHACAMPSSRAVVWNLSLEDIEAQTGRILIHQTCRVAELGSAKCSFDQSHVLYSKLRPYLNKVVLPDQPGVGTSELLPLRPDPENLDREFLAWYLRSPAYLQFANANTQGANLPRVSMKEFRKHRMPVPSLDEQSWIVARIKECMERIGEIRELRSEGLKEAEQLMRCAGREYFGAVDKMPSGWAEYRLDSRADVIYGISAAIAKNKDPSLGPPIIRMANMSLDGELDLSDLRYMPIPEGKEEHFLLRPGDLLLNWRSGSAKHVGKTALFESEGDYTCASFILRIRANPDEADNRYLRHVLNFMRAEGVFEARSRMQVNSKLNAKEFSAFPIRYPATLSEQQQIADTLDAIESTAREIRENITRSTVETDVASNAVLHKAFAGEF